MTWLDGEPFIGRIFSKKMEELLGPARNPEELLTDYHRDLAASIQAVYEEAFFNILNHTHHRTGSFNLCLAGGCAQNSLANGKIYERTSFKNVYIPPAAHDAGGKRLPKREFMWLSELAMEEIGDQALEWLVREGG